MSRLAAAAVGLVAGAVLAAVPAWAGPENIVQDQQRCAEQQKTVPVYDLNGEFAGCM